MRKKLNKSKLSLCQNEANNNYFQNEAQLDAAKIQNLCFFNKKAVDEPQNDCKKFKLELA